MVRMYKVYSDCRCMKKNNGKENGGFLVITDNATTVLYKGHKKTPVNMYRSTGFLLSVHIQNRDQKLRSSHRFQHPHLPMLGIAHIPLPPRRFLNDDVPIPFFFQIPRWLLA